MFLEVDQLCFKKFSTHNNSLIISFLNLLNANAWTVIDKHWIPQKYIIAPTFLASKNLNDKHKLHVHKCGTDNWKKSCLLVKAIVGKLSIWPNSETDLFVVQKLTVIDVNSCWALEIACVMWWSYNRMRI